MRMINKMNQQIKTCIECNRENLGGQVWYEPNHEVVIAFKATYDMKKFSYIGCYCPRCSAEQKFNEGLEGLKLS